MVRYLEKYIPTGKALVADISSGPGRYSLGIAEHGYGVVAVGPVKKSIYGEKHKVPKGQVFCQKAHSIRE